MNLLKRNRRTIYLCKMKKVNGIAKFEEPIELKLNFQPLSSSEKEDFKKFGLENTEILNIICEKDKKDLFKSGDRCYVFTKPPKEHDVLCKESDFAVFSKPIIYLDSISVMLKRLI